MQRNSRRIVMLVVASLAGVMAFAFTYRVMAGESPRPPVEVRPVANRPEPIFRTSAPRTTTEDRDAGDQILNDRGGVVAGY